jgi:hypothetical protein
VAEMVLRSVDILPLQERCFRSTPHLSANEPEWLLKGVVSGL